ncbi:MAG: hypothetical protein IJS26_06670 [Alphaproteobacteria bacterium]|nr:hypothetical protein [Alphaproteobacteria bacterium]
MTDTIFYHSNPIFLFMRKFIALKNAVYYSVEIDGDKTRFFANKQGPGYGARKELQVDPPNKLIINEIISRSTIWVRMSAELKQFIAKLEDVYNTQ